MVGQKAGERKAASEKERKQTRRDYRTVMWFNPSPNASDIEWLEGNANDSVTDLFTLCEGLQTWERLSCKYDPQSTKWTGILFDYGGSEDDDVPALSVRGASAFDALLLLAYFAIRKDGGEWKAAKGADNSRFG